MRMGIYICHCGRNIAGTVNVSGVVEYVRTLPDVVAAREYRYMCSDPGQQMIIEDIGKLGLDKVVIAACSPSMHQSTFMRTMEKAGLNPYCLERANIREQCSWVHSDLGEATEKAKRLVLAAVRKAALSRPLLVQEEGVTPAVLVIGGGIAGIQAALDVARAGFKVYLLEKGPRLGGHLTQLNWVFPSLENAREMIFQKIVALGDCPGIEVLLNSQILEVKGYIGNFKVKVNRKTVSRADINSIAGEENLELAIGSIIVATGYDLLDPLIKPEYGFGVYPNVITGLELEGLYGNADSKIMINGKEPKNIVFIQCVGSRDKSAGVEYCSRICCMYTAKQAYCLKNKIPAARVTVCYIDIRAFSKGCEEFYEKAQKRGVIYRRGVVSEIYQSKDKLLVRAEDTLLGEFYEEEADLVVLATAVTPRRDTLELAKVLNIAVGADGFFLEAHPKLGPVETTTDGIYLAGCCQGPKDITDSISQGHAAAMKALIPLFLTRVKKQPLVAAIDKEICTGCRRCEPACEYSALVFDERRRVMTVNEALCRGCGACCSNCPSEANQLKNCSKKQIFEMISALT